MKCVKTNLEYFQLSYKFTCSRYSLVFFRDNVKTMGTIQFMKFNYGYLHTMHVV